MQRTTAALNDAGERLSRLFLNQSIVNALFGLIIGVGLQIIGVPSAPLWGLIAMILRFVPYVGSLMFFHLFLQPPSGQDGRCC